MVRQKTFKRRVRARMGKTGERYAAARRVLADPALHSVSDPADGAVPAVDAVGDTPAAEAPRPAPAFEPPVSDEAVLAGTGRSWNDWLALLDEEGAAGRSHPEIVQLLTGLGVAHWWAQSVTVGYERARGLRAPGQRSDGWEVGASRTIAVPVGRLYEAVLEDRLREHWLPGISLSLRTAIPERSARFDWPDGMTRIHTFFESSGPARSKLTVQHVRLPDATTADETKRFWRERLAALKAWLETTGGTTR